VIPLVPLFFFRALSLFLLMIFLVSFNSQSPPFFATEVELPLFRPPYRLPLPEADGLFLLFIFYLVCAPHCDSAPPPPLGTPLHTIPTVLFSVGLFRYPRRSRENFMDPRRAVCGVLKETSHASPLHCGPLGLVPFPGLIHYHSFSKYPFGPRSPFPLRLHISFRSPNSF